MQNSMNAQYQQAANYPTFALIFGIGCALIAFAGFLLPWIIIKPSTVANLFNLGALTIMASFGFLWGPTEFMSRFLTGDKKYFTIGFTVSMVLCLYVSAIMRSYILTFIMLAFEVSFLLYFVASFFPGGRAGLSTLFKTACSMFGKCFKMLTG